METSGLHTCEEPLAARYDLTMLDLDGVVYIGSAAVPGVAGQLARAASLGTRLAYVTNNASRSAQTVAEHLASLGLPAVASQVVTSPQAAARQVLQRFPPGSPVAVLGGPGIAAALLEAGLRPVAVTAAEAVAVVTGYGPEVVWSDVVTAAQRIRQGLAWFAANADLTFPTPQGLAPGHGALVALLADFTGVAPVVAGKPEPALLEEVIHRHGGRRPLMVGDRLDTDILGARRAGVDALLVLTGVTGLAELVAADPAERPTYISTTLAGLGETHPAPVLQGGGWSLGGWFTEVQEGRLTVTGQGPASDWWRCVATASWTWRDRHGRTVDTAGVEPPGTVA
ncbi:HAD-IIA family hydrolase [Nocardioides limicola]|uniref:HAD-IIA family hydrolase n=1 Tax=Nocardioides limicola TaxID=2803368 RepID=UPI001EEF81C4|nr:HAD-IIA family hydrolase [Nocardioides sp. DJM-14]